MYLKILESWDGEDWSKFFLALPELSKEQRVEVMEILSKEKKEDIELYFPRLKQLWIINWIWPYWFTNSFRNYITWLFSFFRYEWHDLFSAIGWTEEDRKETDKGMLKYTTFSIQEKTAERIDEGNGFIIWYNLFICVPFKYLVAFSFYGLVRVFGRFWSFRYT